MSLTLGDRLRRLRRGRSFDLSTALEWASRAGYAARGFVYVSIGLLAALASIDLANHPSGAAGAVARLADWPFGQLWVAAVAVGLIGFAVWRALQAFADADRQGTKLKALLSRAGQAISGLVYGVLAYSLFELLDEIEDVREADENNTVQGLTADILDLPLGHWLVLLAGGFILAVAIANIAKAFRDDFCKHLACTKRTRTLAGIAGRIGHAARGLAFLPVAWFLLRAGWTLRAAETRNLGGALQTLEGQPFGSWILLLIGLGLIAFGVFALIEARYRRIDPPDLDG